MPNKYTLPNKILFSVSALVVLILTTGTVAALLAQPAVAQDTSIPTTTHQTQTCDTASSVSPISTSCNGTSNNNIANSPISPIKPVRFECPTDTPFTFNLVGSTCIGLSGVVGSTPNEAFLSCFCIVLLHSQPAFVTGVGGARIQCRVHEIAA